MFFNLPFDQNPESFDEKQYLLFFAHTVLLKNNIKTFLIYPEVKNNDETTEGEVN